jgi:hypothetical protein
MSYHSESQNAQKYNPTPDGYAAPDEQQQWQQPAYPSGAPPGYAPSSYYPAPPVQQTTNTVVVTGQQPTPTVVEIRTAPNDHMALSILTCLFCFWPTAIVALIYSCEVNDRYNAGDHVGAMESSRKASQWGKISFLIGLISYVLVVVFCCVGPIILGVIFGVSRTYTTTTYYNNNY